MSERIRGSYDYALYKSTYATTILSLYSSFHIERLSFVLPLDFGVLFHFWDI